MIEPPFFSVIVPTYNRQQALKDLLTCLIAQDYSPDRFEIIIVNDGSTDGTLAMVKPQVEAGEFVLLTQEHLGPGIARNKGAEIARGDVLVFTDSDCLPEPGWLSALAQAYTIPDGNGSVAVGGPIRNLPGGSWLRRFQARRERDHVANQHPSPLYLDTANASFLKAAFFSVGGFRPACTWSEDVDLGFRLRKAGIRLNTTQNAIVWHAGTTSLLAYFRRSSKIGYANVRLARDYPEIFYPPPPPDIRLAMRRWLECQILRASHSACSLCKLLYFVFSLLSSLAQLLTWEKVFWLKTFPNQSRLFQTQQLPWLTISFYLFLEWLCHLAHTTGCVAYYLNHALQPDRAALP